MVGCTGVSAGVGWQNRLAVDLAVAPVAFEALDLHGTVVCLRAAFGPTVAGGYERAAAKGWFLRAAVGYGWACGGRARAPSLRR